MKVPTDISLRSYITGLIQEDRIAEFYQTDEWKQLRQDVLDEYHNECVRCLEQGIYARAVCVHHVNEVKHRPDLALSTHYKDHDSKEHANLIPLCNACHNEVHDKLGKWQQSRAGFTNKERW